MKPVLMSIVLLLILIPGSAQVPPTVKNKFDLHKLIVPRTVVVIKPLSPALKLGQVKLLMKGKVTPRILDTSTLSEPIRLSVASSFDADDGLAFVSAAFVVQAINNAAFKPCGSAPCPGVLLEFNAQASGYYVLDFYVDIQNGTAAFHLTEVGTGEIQEHPPSGNQPHIIFITNQLEVGTHTFFLEAGNASWSFSSLDISQLKVGN